MIRMKRENGQSIVEFSLALPLLLLITMGVIETSYALLDQHVVTKLTREGSNLISRDVTLQDARVAMLTMSTRPVNFDANAKIILSVLKKGSTVGTVNFDKVILYQRHQYGVLANANSKLTTAGVANFGGAPDYIAPNSDSNANLQITNLPANLVMATGGLVYVTEIYSSHELLTPLENLGVGIPDRLYSIAYF